MIASMNLTTVTSRQVNILDYNMIYSVIFIKIYTGCSKFSHLYSLVDRKTWSQNFVTPLIRR